MNEYPMINVDIPIKRGIQVKIKLIVIFFYNDDDDYEDFLSFFWISAFERGIELLNKENTTLDDDDDTMTPKIEMSHHPCYLFSG